LNATLATALAGTATVGASFNGRQPNVLAYISPAMSGFTGAIAYVAGAEQQLTAADKKGWTLVPLSFELIKNKIKLKIGLGRGKQEFEKREKLKKRDLKREMQRENKQALLKI